LQQCTDGVGSNLSANKSNSSTLLQLNILSGG